MKFEMLLRGLGEMFSRKLGMQVWSSVGEIWGRWRWDL